MSARALGILSRFPAHLEAARPGKQLGHVAESLAGTVDLLSADAAGVRRAHRLAHAVTLRDLLLLGGLHGLTPAHFAVLGTRTERARALLRALAAAVAGGAAADRDAAADALLDLWGISGPAPRLAAWAPLPPAGGAPDLDAAAARLARAAASLVSSRAVLEGTRARVSRLCRLHAAGNGTVRALLDAAAGALDLELDLDRNGRFKDAARPIATVTTAGAPGGATYTYVVVARSAVHHLGRASAPATTTRGAAALNATDFNTITWAPVPGTADYLVFRTASTGTPAETGLITPSALDAMTTSLADTGLAAGAALEPEIDDDLLHSRDRFLHATFVRDRARLTRRVDPAPPPRTVAVDGTITLADLATQLGADAAATLAATVARAQAGEPVDVLLDRDGVLRLALHAGRAVVAPASMRASELARQLEMPLPALLQALVALSAAAPIAVSYDAAGADIVAGAFGFAAIEPRRIPLGPTVVVAELARLTGAAPDAVLQKTVEQGLIGVTLERALLFEAGAELARRLGFEPVPERVVTVEGTITAGELAAAMGVRVSRLVRDLALFDIAGATAATRLGPAAAAQVARRYFYAVAEVPPVDDEIVGMEENPRWREESAALGRRHAELFPVLRRGFGRAIVRVRVDGIAQRTIGPQVVNRDEGHGIGYAAAVAAGATLVFTEEGRALLDTTDVTSFAYAWQGACFAGTDDDPIRPRDFVFDGPGAPAERRAVFAVATPAGALDADFTFPHAGDSLPIPGVNVGRTRFAFFVQEAHHSAADAAAAGGVARVTPRPRLGFLDGSVFASADAAGRPEAGIVQLSWLEREAWAVRVLVPRRFAALDGNGFTTADRVAAALERARPAGVDVRVEYLDERWTLGAGTLAGATTGDPILALMGGTELWTPDDDNP